MNLFRPFRMRQARSRYKFASKAKPFFRVAKKEVLCSSATAKGRHKKTFTQGKIDKAAVSRASGRRLNRLPEWVDPNSYITKGKRHRLFGQDYYNLQIAACRRACGSGRIPYCECGCKRIAFADDITQLRDRGELAHNEHGARKSDELSRVKWMRHECHRNAHNAGGKPNPRKPGRVMSKAEAKLMLESLKCFCDGPKKSGIPFCDDCLKKISAQSLLDLEQLTNREYLEAVADTELELMAAMRRAV